jgi:hypothetical protein
LLVFDDKLPLETDGYPVPTHLPPVPPVPPPVDVTPNKTTSKWQESCQRLFGDLSATCCRTIYSYRKPECQTPYDKGESGQKPKEEESKKQPEQTQPENQPQNQEKLNKIHPFENQDWQEGGQNIQPAQQEDQTKQSEPAQQTGQVNPDEQLFDRDKLDPEVLKKVQAQLDALEREGQEILELARKHDAMIDAGIACENACPGGSQIFQCSADNAQLCIDHNNCIKACDAGVPELLQLNAKIKTMMASYEKKGDILVKRINALTKKQAQKKTRVFRSLEDSKMTTKPVPDTTGNQ